MFQTAMDKYKKAAVSSVLCLLFCVQNWTHGGHAMDLRKLGDFGTVILYNYLSYDVTACLSRQN